MMKTGLLLLCLLLITGSSLANTVNSDPIASNQSRRLARTHLEEQLFKVTPKHMSELYKHLTTVKRTAKQVLAAHKQGKYKNLAKSKAKIFGFLVALVVKVAVTAIKAAHVAAVIVVKTASAVVKATTAIAKGIFKTAKFIVKGAAKAVKGGMKAVKKVMKGAKKLLNKVKKVKCGGSGFFKKACERIRKHIEDDIRDELCDRLKGMGYARDAIMKCKREGYERKSLRQKWRDRACHEVQKRLPMWLRKFKGNSCQKGDEATSFGCFKDSRRRTLPYRLGLNAELVTPRNCARECSLKGYKYAGLQYSYQCFCGDKLPSNGGYGCNKKCKGNEKAKCGGNWRNSIWAAGSKDQNKVCSYRKHRMPRQRGSRYHVVGYRIFSQEACARLVKQRYPHAKVAELSFRSRNCYAYTRVGRGRWVYSRTSSSCHLPKLCKYKYNKCPPWKGNKWRILSYRMYSQQKCAALVKRKMPNAVAAELSRVTRRCYGWARATSLHHSSTSSTCWLQ